jgi:hypothetical protein
MIYLITIIISIMIIFWWIKIANKYAYNNSNGKKFRVPNFVKILLYAVCIIPFLNVALAFILVTAISFIEFEWKGWEENKLLYWLFKK